MVLCWFYVEVFCLLDAGLFLWFVLGLLRFGLCTYGFGGLLRVRGGLLRGFVG